MIYILQKICTTIREVVQPQDGGKTAGAPLPFATHAPLVFDKIGSGAKGSAGQRGAAKMRNYGAFSLPRAVSALPRAVSALSPAASAAAFAHFRYLCAFSLPLRIFAAYAHFRYLCAFSLPLRIFAAPCALPLLPPALPLRIFAAFAHFCCLMRASFTLPRASLRIFAAFAFLQFWLPKLKIFKTLKHFCLVFSGIF